jgi:hypothetical protein
MLDKITHMRVHYTSEFRQSSIVGRAEAVKCHKVVKIINIVSKERCGFISLIN